MVLPRGNIRAAIEAIGESDTLIAGHLTTRLTSPLAWNDATITVASTDRFPTPGTIKLDGESIEVTTASATAFTITSRPRAIPSTPTISIGAKITDISRLYSDFDIARAQMFINTATGKWLARIGENYGVGLPSYRGVSLFLTDDRYREYLKIICFLQAGPRWGMMRVLQSVFPPTILTGSTDSASPYRVSFATSVLPFDLRRSLIRMDEDWTRVHRIERIDPSGKWLDLSPVDGPTWTAANFSTVASVQVELLMWDLWEEGHRPGEFFIHLYKSNSTTYPWGATYLQGGEEQVSPTAAEVFTDGLINQVTGVWLATDVQRTGTNYWLVGGNPATTGTFAGNLITLGTSLPAAGTPVLVDYGTIDPSTAQLLADFTVQNDPPGAYWPFYLHDYASILVKSGIIDLIRAMGCLPVVSSSTLGPAVTPVLEEELPVLASGIMFTRPSSDVVRLTPSGAEAKSHIWCHDGAGDWVKVEVDANLDCDLTTVGAGGRDSGSYVLNTDYQIFLIAKGTLAAGLRVPKLIAVLNGAAIVPTLPSGYTHYSLPISFASVDGSVDIRDFVQVGETYRYQEATGVVVESAYKATANSNTDCSNAVPYYAYEMLVQIAAENNDSGVGTRDGQVDDKNGSLQWFLTMSGDEVNDAASSKADTTIPIPHIRGTAPELDASWSATITSGGITLIIQGFKLFLG